MGGCFGSTDKLRRITIDYGKINVDKLIDSWSSGEVLMIKESLQEFCQQHKQKKLGRKMLADFFPKLARFYPESFHMRLFTFFDWDNDGYLSAKELVYGLAVLQKTDLRKFSQVLYGMYRREPTGFMTQEQYRQFVYQNRKMFNGTEQTTNIIAEFENHEMVLQSQFTNIMEKTFDLERFRDVFSIGRNEQEKELMELLKRTGYSIDMQQDRVVYVLEYRWFEAWRRYAELKYELLTEIHFSGGINNKFSRRYTLSAESVLFRVPEENRQQYMRPRPIDNTYLQGDFEGELREGLQLDQDFVFVTEEVWKGLKASYGGGPEFKRRYPQIYPVTVNLVYLTKEGKFEVKYKIAKRYVSVTSILGPIIGVTNNSFLYKRNLADDAWTKISPDRTVAENDVYNQAFICVVDPTIQSKFLEYYNNGEHKKQVGYADSLIIREGEETLTGYVMGLENDKVWVYFKNKPIETRKEMTIRQFLEHSRQPRQMQRVRIVSGLYNLGNSCYVNSVVQCLLASPVLENFLINEKYKDMIDEERAKKPDLLLIKHLSQLAKKANDNPTHSHRPKDLRRSIIRSMPRFDNYEQQDAEQFLCEFLNSLSGELSTRKTDITKTIDLKGDEEQSEDYSVIGKFFQGQEIRTFTCQQCKNVITKRQASYSLGVPVPEIDHIFFYANFYPAKPANQPNFQPILKLGAMVRKDILFQQLAKLFSSMVGRPLKKLVFCMVQLNEIHDFVRDLSYKRKVETLKIRESETLYIYEEKSTSEYFGRYLPPAIKVRKERSFPWNLKAGDLADVYAWTQWVQCIFISINEQSQTVKCETLEGENDYDLQHLAPHLSYTRNNPASFVQVVHRKYNAVRDRPDYFSVPFLVPVAEWMRWNDVVEIINSEAERFIDREYYANAFNMETPNPDYPSTPAINHQDGHQEARLKRTGSFIIDGTQTRTNSNMSQSHVHQVNGVEGPRLRKGSQHNQNISIEPQPGRKKELSKVAQSTVPYRIKILSRRSEVCVFCHKFTRIDGRVASKYHYEGSYLCQGCTAKETLPIGLLINIKDVIFSLDWDETLAFNTAAIRPIQHRSFIDTQNLQRELRNTLSQCFQLYAQKQSGIDLRCQKCQHNESALLTRVSRSPNLLIIHLRRFKYSGGYLEKLLNRIQLPFDISLNSISDSPQPDNKYQLYGVVCHRGSGFAGHYFSYVLKNRKTWIKCDDDTTSIADIATIDLSEVYLLFYRKLNMSSSLLAL